MKPTEIPNLRIGQIADSVGCHRETVKNYEKRGLIVPVRDQNGFRRYTLTQAWALKVLFEHQPLAGGAE